MNDEDDIVAEEVNVEEDEHSFESVAEDSEDMDVEEEEKSANKQSESQRKKRVVLSDRKKEIKTRCRSC